MSEEKIALVLRSEGTSEILGDLISLEQRLGNVTSQIKDLTKAGQQNTEKFKELKIAQKALTIEKTKLNAQIKKSVTEFGKLDKALPKDSLQAMKKEASDLKKVISSQSQDVRENNGIIKELGLSYNDAVAKSQKMAEENRRLTKELNNQSKELKQAAKDLDKYGKAVPDDSIEGMAREAANLRRVLRTQSSEVRENDGHIDELGLTYSQAAAKSKQFRDTVRDADKELGDYSSNIGNYTSAFQDLGGIFESVSGVSLGFAAGGVGAFGVQDLLAAGSKLPGVIGKASASLAKIPVPALAAAGAVLQIGSYALKVNEEFDKMRHKVSSVTGATGELLSRQTADITSFSQTFDKDFNDTLEAAQAISKGFGISVSDSMDLLKVGALSGADAYGELLTKAREYPKLLANAGYSAEDFIKIVSQEVKGGIYDDKLVDSIKEAGLSLTELTVTQKDALEASFGREFADRIFNQINNEGASVKQVIQEITAEAEKNGLSQQKMAVITADVFKGAGEDAGGLQSIMENLAIAMDTDIENLVDRQDDYTRAQLRTLDANERLALGQARLSSLLDSSTSNLSIFATNLKAFGTEALNEVIVKSEVLFSYLDALVNWDADLIKTELEVIADSKAQAIIAQKEQEKVVADTSKREEEIENARKRRDEQKKSRDKAEKQRLREAAAAKREADRDIAKIEEDAEAREKKAQEDKIAASQRIIDLENQLIKDKYEKQREIAKTNSERQILSLVGTPEQIAQQKSLLESQLKAELDAIDKAETKAEADKATRQNVLAEESRIMALEGVRDMSKAIATKTISDEEELQSQLNLIDFKYSQERIRLRLEQQNLTFAERQALLLEQAEIEKEINDEKNEDIVKGEEEANREREKLQKKLTDVFETGAKNIGESFVAMFDGTEESADKFKKAFLGLLLDLIIAQITAQASAAQATELATKGLFGIGTGLAVRALVLGLLGGVRSALKFEEGGGTGMVISGGNEFDFPAYQGGLIKGPSHDDGGVKFRVKRGGKSFLGEARGGEVILNEKQIRALRGVAGKDIFSRIGVPGANNRSFNTGGFVPNVTRSVEVQDGKIVKSGFDEDQYVKMADMISKVMRDSNIKSKEDITEALGDALEAENRRQERKEINKKLNTL